MTMDPAVVQYVLRHGRRDLSSLMHTLDSLDRISLEQHRALTVPLVREIMQTTSA
jgi:DnaA family protein